MIAVQAWSGANASPFDVENGNTVDGTTVQPGSVTPSQDNSLIVTGLVAASEAVDSVDGGYTTTVKDDTGAHQNQGTGFAYLVQGSAAATNPTWSGGTFALHTAVIAAFKPA